MDDQGGVLLELLFFADAKGASRGFNESFLPDLNVLGMNFVLGGQLGRRTRWPFIWSRSTLDP